MYISQRSVYQNSNLTSIVPLYSRKRYQEDQTKDKYRGHHCLFKFVTGEAKEVKLKENPWSHVRILTYRTWAVRLTCI